MSIPGFYRYFFAFRPDPLLRCWLATLGERAGQSAKRNQGGIFSFDYLRHRRVCTARPLHRLVRCFRARRPRPLFLPVLARPPAGRAHGAAIRTMARQHEIQYFYRTLLAYLGERDILPLHRKTGLRPHVTLGRDPCIVDLRLPPREWVPDELLLIESEVGKGIHHVIARWPLLPPRQGAFAFGEMPRLAA